MAALPTEPAAGPDDVPEVDAAATELADALADAATPPAVPVPPTSPEALAAWLGGRRWFAAAQRPEADQVGAVVEVPLPTAPALAVGLVEVGPDRYQLLVPGTDHPLTGRPDVGDDPASADQLARWLTAPVPSAAQSTPANARAATGPAVVAHWPDPDVALGDAPARALGGEQSNTSVVVGGTHVLKLFRRLQAGVHPEVEVGRHLALVAAEADPAVPTAPVAPLAGWYELAPEAGPSGGADEGSAPTALGVVQELVPGALDAWGLVLSALAGDPGRLLARLHQLGAGLAHLHGALAQPAPGATGAVSSDPEAPESFGAVPLAPGRVAELADAVATDAARLLSGDAHRSADLAPLVGRGDDTAELARRLAARLGPDLGAAIRHHGDLHLGQVVDSHRGWVFLDFEGEPTRSLTERRRRHSPLRDVAGMLRSFAYAAATVRRAGGHRLVDGWEPAARAAFLDGYLAAVDPALLPASPVATRTLLSLLELEKVVYEIGYELDHRPEWVGLPVAGLRRLLDGGPA